MTPSVLVLDSNAAVQAIISAALKQAGIQVECLTDGAGVLEKIKRLQPFALLVSSDIPNSDAFALCRAVKKDTNLKWIQCILLASGSEKAGLQTKAKQAGFDGVLFKPFKSDQVRTLVEKKLAASSPPAPKKTEAAEQPRDQGSPKEGPLAVLVKEPFLRLGFQFLMEHYSGNALAFDSSDELASSAAVTVFAATVTSTEDAGDLNWYNPNTMGRLIILDARDPELQKMLHAPENAIKLQRPLSVSAMRTALEAAVVLSQESAQEVDPPLDQGQQVLLSARISAGIYEKLLTLESLENRKWEEACSTLAAEALKICRGFQE